MDAVVVVVVVAAAVVFIVAVFFFLLLLFSFESHRKALRLSDVSTCLYLAVVVTSTVMLSMRSHFV